MKKTIISLGLYTAVMASILASASSISEPAAPNAAEFAQKLVDSFGGKDQLLNEKETLRVLVFLQEHLPESTGPGGITGWMSTDRNFGNAARGDMTDERHALRNLKPEYYLPEFIRKYDINKDGRITQQELTPAMIKFIGLPSTRRDWSKREIAKR